VQLVDQILDCKAGRPCASHTIAYDLGELPPNENFAEFQNELQ